MADRPKETARNPLPEHELGTGGDQDIVKGPRAPDDAVFVRVGSADDPFEADLLASALEDEGIPVVARAQKDHLLDPLVNPNAAFWVVMVPAAYRQQATEIVERRHREMLAREHDAEEAASEEELATESTPIVPLGGENLPR